jgi:hypothetical protein
MTNESLVFKVLAAIPDDRSLINRKDEKTPLTDLMDDYTKLTLTDTALPAIEPTWCASEFKAALALVNPVDLIKILHRYTDQAAGDGKESAVSPWLYQEDPAVAERRKFLQWVWKAILIFIGVFILMVTATVLLIGVKTNQIDSELIKSIMTMVIDVAKLFISPGPTPLEP